MIMKQGIFVNLSLKGFEKIEKVMYTISTYAASWHYRKAPEWKTYE